MNDHAVILDTSVTPPLVITGDEGGAFVSVDAARSWLDTMAPSVRAPLVVVRTMTLGSWLNNVTACAP